MRPVAHGPWPVECGMLSVTCDLCHVARYHVARYHVARYHVARGR